MSSLKGNLDKKTKGTPKSFKGSLNENTAILENLVTKLRIPGVLGTKITPHAFRSLRARGKRGKKTERKGQGINKEKK